MIRGRDVESPLRLAPFDPYSAVRDQYVIDAVGLEPLAEVLPARFGPGGGKARVPGRFLFFLEGQSSGPLDLVRGVLDVGFTQVPLRPALAALEMHDDTHGIDVEQHTQATTVRTGGGLAPQPPP